MITEPEIDNLIIEPGEVISKPPRLYPYDSIHIKAGGVLKINDNGAQWLILQARIIVCEGVIEYINIRRGLGTIAYTLPNGEKIEHTFREGLGGAGGAGSGNNHQQGGLGYAPHDYNGGGGGSGAYYTGTPRTDLPGLVATDFRGARSPGNPRYSFGGNGARQNFGHGGLIYILADQISFSPTAEIRIKGTDGVNGSAAGGGDCYGGGQVYDIGGGGGGGGTAGGNGGVLIVKCKDVTNMPVVNTNPGKGGLGGIGGRSARCGFHGQDGFPGDDGEQGYADWQ